MKWVSLDEIVTSVLMQKRYPIHWYLECLKYAADCLRELHFDDLKSVRSEKLLLNSYKAVTIPCDYLDFVRIGIGNGQLVQPLVNRNGINRLNNTEVGGEIIPYGESTDDSLLYDLLPSNHTSTGEQLGRYYGFSARAISDGYTILKERNEIQFDENIAVSYIILDYISDCSDSDNATKITPYAQATIEAYIKWQLKANNRSYPQMEASMAELHYYNQRRILRARLSDLTLDDIKRAVRAGSHGSIKS